MRLELSGCTEVAEPSREKVQGSLAQGLKIKTRSKRDWLVVSHGGILVKDVLNGFLLLASFHNTSHESNLGIVFI